MKFAASLILSASLLPTVGHGVERPPFVATYGINCRDDLQCALVIETPKKDAYLAIWVVSARLDYNDMKCAIPLYMRDTQDGFLRAGLDGKAVDIERTSNGGVFVRGLPIAESSVRQQLATIVRLMTIDADKASELVGWLVKNAPAVDRYTEAQKDIVTAIRFLMAAQTKLETD